MKRAPSLPIAIMALAASAALAGCTSTVPAESAGAAGGGSSSAAATASTNLSAEITITDPWVKATDGTMTGAFGVIANNTDQDIHVVAVSTSVTGRAEIHETVGQDGTMVMQEMQGGFVILAGDEFVLQPGGNHLMLMDLPRAIEAGEEVDLTLEFEDGGTFSWIAPARTYSGGQEEYRGGTESGMPSESTSPTQG